MARYPVSGKTIKKLREAHSVSPNELADAIDISNEDLADIERSETPLINLGRLDKLSEIFGNPIFDFGPDAEPLAISQLPDFRTTNNAPAKISINAWKKINQAEQYKYDIEEILADDHDLTVPLKLQSISTTDDVAKSASRIREKIGLSWDYQVSDEKHISLFNFVRSRIEQLGINVIQVSYPPKDSRGFCLLSETEGADLIAINRTNTTDGAKTFTLLHEVAHVLLRREGMSDFTILRNKLERFCNKIAAEVLMPEDEFSEFVLESVSGHDIGFGELRTLSRTIGVSQFSFAIRLVEMGLVDSGFVVRWRESLPPNALARLERGILDPVEADEDGFRRSTTGTRKLSDIGTGISSLALAALQRGLRGEVDIFRSFRIRPEQVDAVRTALENRLKALSKVG